MAAAADLDIDIDIDIGDNMDKMRDNMDNMHTQGLTSPVSATSSSSSSSTSLHEDQKQEDHEDQEEDHYFTDDLPGLVQRPILTNIQLLGPDQGKTMTGRIYRAIYTPLGDGGAKQEVVVKETDPQKAEACTQRSRENPYREGPFLHKVRNVEGVVRAIADYRHPVNGTYYLLLEHVQGCDLFEYLAARSQANRPLDLEEIRIVGYKLANIIHRLHQHGVAHMDISCENIMFEEKVNPADHTITMETGFKLIDFGQAIDLHQEPMPQYGRCGKFSYMPPECIYHQILVPTKFDVHCLGVVLFTLKQNTACRIYDYISTPQEEYDDPIKASKIRSNFKKLQLFSSPNHPWWKTNNNEAAPMRIECLKHYRDPHPDRQRFFIPKDLFEFLVYVMQPNFQRRPSMSDVILHPFLSC
jgi:serine/threonine protein kinase